MRHTTVVCDWAGRVDGWLRCLSCCGRVSFGVCTVSDPGERERQCVCVVCMHVIF